MLLLTSLLTPGLAPSSSRSPRPLQMLPLCGCVPSEHPGGGWGIPWLRSCPPPSLPPPRYQAQGYAGHGAVRCCDTSKDTAKLRVKGGLVIFPLGYSELNPVVPCVLLRSASVTGEAVTEPRCTEQWLWYPSRTASPVCPQCRSVQFLLRF